MIMCKALKGTGLQPIKNRTKPFLKQDCKSLFQTGTVNHHFAFKIQITGQS